MPVFVYSLSIILLITADRVLKVIAVNKLSDGLIVSVGDFIQLRYTENKGAAFSLFQGKPFILIVFTLFAILLCCFVLFCNLKGNKLKNIGLLLIISGGIGNLIDRIFLGYVVDFIEPLFINFAIFNFADICITTGAFIILLYEIIDFANVKSKKN